MDIGSPVRRSDNMARPEIVLTEEQQRRNEEILARLAAEEQRVLEETRALQAEWKSSHRRQYSEQPFANE
jgi:hypothetical protein